MVRTGQGGFAHQGEGTQDPRREVRQADRRGHEKDKPYESAPWSARSGVTAVGGNSARREIARRFEHRIGGAGDQMVVQPLDVAQQIERRRLGRGGLAAVAQLRRNGS